MEGPGLFFEPTILTHVDDHMFVSKEESFGPIMIISMFDNGYVHLYNVVRDKAFVSTIMLVSLKGSKCGFSGHFAAVIYFKCLLIGHVLN